MSPIFFRPVREQIEHDRIIRHLQAKLKRKYEIAVNTGATETASVKAGGLVLFPDLVLTDTGKSKKLAGVIEVETGESVNHLEAMAQWAHFGKLKVPFHLYVPVASADIAWRLCADHQVRVDELWTYHGMGEAVRLTLAHKGAPAGANGKGARSKASPAKAKAPKTAAAKGAKKVAKKKPAAAKKTTKKVAKKKAKAKK